MSILFNFKKYLYPTSAFVRPDYAAFATQNKPVHYAQEFLNRLVDAKKINNPEIWADLDSFVTKAQALALIDKITGGTWGSDEADASIHWVQPIVISLCGKGIVSDKDVWLNAPDAFISKALCLALVDAATSGTKSQYIGRATDHWARNCLDSLCDKAIVTTPHAWDDDFEGTVKRGNFLALVCKAFGI